MFGFGRSVSHDAKRLAEVVHEVCHVIFRERFDPMREALLKLGYKETYIELSDGILIKSSTFGFRVDEPSMECFKFHSVYDMTTTGSKSLMVEAIAKYYGVQINWSNASQSPDSLITVDLSKIASKRGTLGKQASALRQRLLAFPGFLAPEAFWMPS
jgi:hypothetical protein